MLFQLVEEKYQDWEENHPASEIEFAVNQQTAAGHGCIRMEVTPAESNESKDWNIYFKNVSQVKEHQCMHHR